MINVKLSELHIIGSGTGLPSPKRSAPGILLRVEGKNILLDSGAGTFQRLAKMGITYKNIDYILFSHLHPDHTLDMVSFLFAARYPVNPRRKEIVFIGPQGLKDFYDRLVGIYNGSITPTSYKVTIKEIRDGELDFKSWQLKAKPLPHTERSIGFRIQTKNNKIICYSGDTDYSDNIVELAKDSDILILECSTPNPIKVKGHLTPSAAGKIASQSKSKKLVLTHFYPICDNFPIAKQASASFNGEVILAEDYKRIKI